MQNFLRNHSRSIQIPLIHEGCIKKRYIEYYSVSVLIFFLTACATTQLPAMQPLTGDITEEKIVSEIMDWDHILVFHKTQGQMPIRFVGVDKEYLYFFDIDETQNLYSVMNGKIYLKDIDRIELIKRNLESSEIATGTSQSTKKSTDWAKAGVSVVFAILLFPLMIALAL